MSHITSSTINTIKTLIFNKVIKYLDDNGITITFDNLDDNINIKQLDLKHINMNIEDTPQTETPIPKFRVKKQPPKFKLKKNDHTLFTEICNTHNIHYFLYYDENNWRGPAIKIKKENDEILLHFSGLKTVSLKGIDFYIIHPTSLLNDDSIHYKPFINPEINNENNELDNINDSNEIETIDWIHMETNTRYLLDEITNNLYSYETSEFIGKKTNEFTIDLNSKE
jgi:hypothetical protein